MTGRRHPSRRGFSLVELLVAAALASTLLAASWGWLWTAAASARRADRRAQASTAHAFAARMLRADMARAVALGQPEDGVCGPTTVVLVSRDPFNGLREVTTVAFDPRRGVLWRKAPGSYLAEGVASCLVRYFAGDGKELLPVSGVLGLDQRAKTRRVVIEWTTAETTESERRLSVHQVSATLLEPVASSVAGVSAVGAGP